LSRTLPLPFSCGLESATAIENARLNLALYEDLQQMLAAKTVDDHLIPAIRSAGGGGLHDLTVVSSTLASAAC
jgi:hypothetical protein